MFNKLDAAGPVLSTLNDTEFHKDITYASITAPQLTYVEVQIDGEVVDGVWVAPGSSHSWWTYAGGKLLPGSGLPPGSTLIVTASGPCAFRYDWS